MEILIPSASTIVEITQEIWASVLEDAGELVAEPLDLKHPDDAVLAFIEITGHWQGSVRISSSLRIARHIAAGMFGKSESDVQDDELSDAVGEFTNIVGGNIKALFPAPCNLSLPGVAGIGTFGDELPPGFEIYQSERLVGEAHLSWQSEHLVVSLWEAANRPE